MEAESDIAKAQRPLVKVRSLTFKLTIVLLAVSLVPMTVIAYFNLRGSLTTVSASEQRNLAQLAASIAVCLDQLIRDNQRIVNFISTDPDVVSFLSDPSRKRKEDQEPITSILLRVKAASTDIASTYVMNRDGVMMAASYPEVVGKNLSHREYFQIAMGGKNYVSNLLVGGTSKESGVYFSGPVRNDKEEIVGVALVKLDGQAVYDILDQVNRSKMQAQAFLIDEDGVIISHPDPSLLYHSLSQLSQTEIEEIQKHSQFPVQTIKSVNLPDVAEAMLKSTEPGYLSYFDPKTKDPYVLGFARMAWHFWVVGVREHEAVFTKPLNLLFYKGLGRMAAVGILVLILAFFLGRALVRPIRSLTEATRILSGARGKPESVSASEEEEFRLNDIVKAKLTHISETYSDEIGQLAKTFNEMVDKLHEYIIDLKEVTTANERIESDLRIGRDIQNSVLPRTFPAFPHRKEFDIFALMEAAKEVGGDFYDFFFITEKKLCFIIGDVSGKGVPAALFMMITKTLLKTIALRDLSPEDILFNANNIISSQNERGMFVTIQCAILDTETGELKIGNAGHNPPLIGKGIGQDYEFITLPESIVLGPMEDVTFSSVTVMLKPDDIIFLYTDGITEAMNPRGEIFSDDRLRTTLSSLKGNNITEIVCGVRDEVKNYAQEAPQSDDITIVALHYKGKF